MPADAVKRALYSLSCAKYKILNKSPEGKTVNPEDVFRLTKNSPIVRDASRLHCHLPMREKLRLRTSYKIAVMPSMQPSCE